MNTNILLETDEVVIEEALDAFDGHRDFPNRLPRCEEEDGAMTAAIGNFFDEWLTDRVADFYEDGFTSEEALRAIELAFDFECAVLEALTWHLDIERTNASLPR